MIAAILRWWREKQRPKKCQHRTQIECHNTFMRRAGVKSGSIGFAPSTQWPLCPDKVDEMFEILDDDD